MIRRETVQKKTILEILRKTNSHPTADSVYDEVRKVIPNISKGTVYRNLKVLQNDGLISELNTAGEVSRFDGNLQEHYHFRCEKCGRVFDLDEPVDEEINYRIAKTTGFKVSYHHFEFRGLCGECK